jgi:hypothetical protein
MIRSESLVELTKALVKAQGKMKGAKADTKNDFFKSNYADLASVWEAIRIPLSDNGLAIIQTTQNNDKGIEVETTLLHISGEWCAGSLFMPAEKTTAQAFGSLLTYGRRYSLAAIVGIAQIDDDGESVMNRTKPSKVENNSGKNVTKCLHDWRVSKFNDSEEYCIKGCKGKRPINAEETKD